MADESKSAHEGQPEGTEASGPTGEGSSATPESEPRTVSEAGPAPESEPPAALEAEPAAEPEPRQKPRKRRGIVGPTLLILVGLVLLLNNLGVLPWSVWGVVWRAWPVLLILVGLDLLIGRRHWWSTLALVVITILVIGAVVWLGWMVLPTGPASREVFTRDLGATRPDVVRVHLEHGVAELTVRASEDASRLIEARIRKGPGETIQTQETGSEREIAFTLSSRSAPGRALIPFPDMLGRWDIELGPAVPLELDLQAGVGESDLDLTGLALRRLDIRGGVGAAEIALPKAGDIRARVDGGLGALTVRVPRSLAATIRVEGGLGAVDVPSSYTGEGGLRRSAGLPGGGTLDLLIKGGMGAVDVVEVE